MRNSSIRFLRSTMLTGLLALSALTIQVTPAALAADRGADTVVAINAADAAAAPSMVAQPTCRSFATCIGSRTSDGYELDAGGPGVHLDRDGDD